MAPTMPTQTGCGGTNVPIPSHDSWADDCSTQRESVEAVAKRVAQLNESHQEELQCLQAVNDSLQWQVQQQENLTCTLFQQLCTERAASIELQEWLQRALAAKEDCRKALWEAHVRLGALECELDLAEVAQLKLRRKLQRTQPTEDELREAEQENVRLKEKLRLLEENKELERQLAAALEQAAQKERKARRKVEVDAACES